MEAAGCRFIFDADGSIDGGVRAPEQRPEFSQQTDSWQGSYPAGIRPPHFLLRVYALLGLMASDEAARGCSDDAVMAGIVTRHAPDDGALQAPLGRGRRRQRNQ